MWALGLFSRFPVPVDMGLYTEEGRDSMQRHQLGNDSLSLRASPSMWTAKMLPLPETQSGHLTNETHWMY